MCRHFVCFGTEGDYFSPHCAHGIAQVAVCHVFLCVVHIVSPPFLCDTISMEEELLHSPRLPGSPTCIAPDTPERKVCSNRRGMQPLAISDVDLLLQSSPRLRKQRQRNDHGG